LGSGWFGKAFKELVSQQMEVGAIVSARKLKATSRSIGI
jgi:hypothetical protein